MDEWVDRLVFSCLFDLRLCFLASCFSDFPPVHVCSKASSHSLYLSFFCYDHACMVVQIHRHTHRNTRTKGKRMIHPILKRKLDTAIYQANKQANRNQKDSNKETFKQANKESSKQSRKDDNTNIKPADKRTGKYTLLDLIQFNYVLKTTAQPGYAFGLTLVYCMLMSISSILQNRKSSLESMFAWPMTSEATLNPQNELLFCMLSCETNTLSSFGQLSACWTWPHRELSDAVNRKSSVCLAHTLQILRSKLGTSKFTTHYSICSLLCVGIHFLPTV